MTWAPSGSVTGATVPGFTTPAYTVSADTFPGPNGKQFAITALGGTQTGVNVHSVSNPFTVAFARPVAFKMLPAANPVSGLRPNVPRNVYKQITRKGVQAYANAPYATMLITTSAEIPAGADSYDAANVKAGWSSHVGILSNQSSGIADTLLSGIM